MFLYQKNLHKANEFWLNWHFLPPNKNGMEGDTRGFKTQAYK